MKKIIALLLCAIMVLAMAACGAKEEPAPAPAPAEKPAETPAETPAAPAEDPDAEWKKEPAYGTTLKYWISEGCSSAPGVAEALGYYEAEGLKVEGFKGQSDIEAIGTRNVDIAVGHIAKALVPSTNGVNCTFVGGAHLLQGCKAIYVLADSEYQTYEDLKGHAISVPNGIGASDYNITARLMLECGIDPLSEVELTPVDKDACVAAMQNGEIAAALLSESFGYPQVEQGILRKIDSANGDSQNELCCIIMMNSEFIKENPITAAKMASAVKKALNWMGSNPDECVVEMQKLGLINEKTEMNLELNKRMNFGLLGFEDQYVTDQMRGIVEDYIKAGLITSMNDVDAIMNKMWTPIGSID